MKSFKEKITISILVECVSSRIFGGDLEVICREIAGNTGKSRVELWVVKYLILLNFPVISKIYKNSLFFPVGSTINLKTPFKIKVLKLKSKKLRDFCVIFIEGS